MKTLLGIDLGTTGCKAAIYSSEGDPLGESYLEIPLIKPAPGVVEQDAAQWWTLTQKAIRQALLPHFPSLDVLHLRDVKVRIVNPHAGTAATTRVVIEFHDPTCGYFGTVGVDDNIIQASWKALTDAIEYKLLNESEKK